MIYLAGAISGVSLTDASYWRNKVEAAFPGQCCDPLDFEFDGQIHEPREIIQYDLARILKCGAVLANVGQPSWGTPMEIFYAYQHHIPVYAFGPMDISPWVRGHARMFPLLEPALVALQGDGHVTYDH